MATAKSMNQINFEKIVKELTSYAEVIRSRQDQKQVIIDDFEKERKRFKSGKISKKSLSSSVPRVKKELDRLDLQIKKNIMYLKNTADKVKKFASSQSPKGIKVSVSGMAMKATPKKKKKKVSKK